MTTFSLIASIFAALLVGAAICYFILQRKLNLAREQNISLSAELNHSRQQHETQLAALNAQNEQMNHTFSSLASEALLKNSESFLKLAQEKLTQAHMQGQHVLEKKEKSFETMVAPIKEALQKTEQQIRAMEHERKEAYGSLSKHLESMAQTQQILQGETRNLVQALRRPEVRGQWGEMTLKRLAELAGMVEHCDFFEQTHLSTESGALRPDMVVRLPGGRDIIVDAKTPLDAYLNATEASDDEEKKSELKRHCKNVRDRIRELSLKSYWEQFEDTPEFVVLFIPGDQFLSAALEQDQQLLEYGFQQKVILATPTSLVALLRAVAFGWRQEKVEENALQIKQLGEELFVRVATLTEHLGKLGKNLDSSVSQFNKVVGTLDRRVLPSARKFTELGISGEKKPLQEVEPIEKLSSELSGKSDPQTEISP